MIRDISELTFFMVCFLLTAYGLGKYMLWALMTPCEEPLLLGRRFSLPQWRQAMSAHCYLQAMLIFNLLGLLALLALQLTQHWLPLNPMGLPNVRFDTAVSAAMSFVTNTNWQSYAGETTMSLLTQMTGMAVQNFLSAATGLSVLLCLMRGVVGQRSDTIGNFWVDISRCVFYVLLPLAALMALFLVSQGVVQTWSGAVVVQMVEGGQQELPVGPVASQVAIKQLGTNGGGYYNANAAHPFENPTPFSNFVETLALLALPGGCVFLWGFYLRNNRQLLMLLSVMTLLFLLGLALAWWSEAGGNPSLGAMPFLEGKEWRFSLFESVLWGVATTSSSNGSVNSMLDSFSPLAGGVALFNILLGEIIYGGIGVGMVGMVLYVLLTVFLCGLMIGRTPEYLGKKIGQPEIFWVMVGILAPSLAFFAGTMATLHYPEALTSLSNPGPHGFSQLLYGVASPSNNNGSAFAGLNADTPFYNIMQALCMLVGRLAVVVPGVLLAGLLAKKKAAPPSAGQLPTDNVTFGGMLLAVIIIVGALTYFPALCLGPIAEHGLNQNHQLLP